MRLSLSNPLMVVTAAFVVVASVSISGFYCFKAASPNIVSDTWFFILRFLMPSYENGISFQGIFTLRAAADHLQPVHRVLLYLNANYLGLDLRYDAYVGYLSLLASAILLVTAFCRCNGIKGYNKVYIYAAFFVVMFSMRLHRVFEWPLVTLGYLTILFIFIVFTYFDRALRDLSKWPLQRHVIAFSLFFLMLLLGDDTAMVAICAMLVVSILYAAVSRSTITTISLHLIGALIAYKIFKNTFVIYLGSHQSNGLNNLLWGIENIPIAVGFIIKVFFSTLFDKQTIAKLFGGDSEHLIYILGTLTAVFHLWVAWYFFKAQIYKKSWLPMITWIFGLGLAAGIFLYRAQIWGTDAPLFPRYQRVFNLLNILPVWVFCHVLFERRNSKQKIAPFSVLSTWVLISGLLFSLGATDLNIKIKRHVRYQEQQAKAVIEFSQGKAIKTKAFKCNNSVEECKKAVSFLKERELNVFSKNYIRN